MLAFRKAVPADIEPVGQLYDAICEYLESHVNYSGWRKGCYPTVEDAEAGAAAETLFVAADGERIVGALILTHASEESYAGVDWHLGQKEPEAEEILEIHTFAVHPDYLHRGVGRQFVKFVLSYAAEQGIKAVRLDTYEKNEPAVRLYEGCGFQYMGLADLGLGESFGLKWFKLYQYVL